MAENIVLSVSLRGAETVIPKLTEIDNLLTSIRQKQAIKIQVSAPGLTKAANNAQKLATNLKNAAGQSTVIGNQGAKNLNNAGNAARNASRNAESFNNGMMSVVGTMLKFRLASSAINLVITGFKDAFKEMKAVDSEMVNIRKVTGFATDELERMSKNAFSLASKYGRSASEVLTGETVFARAGYTSQIEQLGELSLLLQNVGDLQADDAAKFIIATDKAYKLGGSYEKLMEVIDGLDLITNKNATDMQKMTDGMTVAGSVFAESGESIEMFAALLGTATANTQRSGSEMARGLRTIIMNLRQIRGESEDGELIDGESIAAASKALKDYANISTMENGQIRKASDVLAELAGVWDTLTETQRAAIAEGVANKRQANVLMALMADWESVNTMMGQYENAAGTAARENEMYMESWAAKTEVVKASWTELVANMADTDVIKGGLDLVASALDRINSLFDTAEQRTDKLQDKAKKASETAAADRASYEQDFGAGSRYDQLVKNYAKLTDAEKVELGILESQRKERERLLQLAEDAARKEAEAVAKEQQKQLNARDKEASKYGLMLSTQINAFNDSLLQTKDVDAYADRLARVVSEYSEYYNSLVSAKEAGTALTEQEQGFIEGYGLIAKVVGEGGNAVEAYGKVTAAASRASGDQAEKAVDAGNRAIETISLIGDYIENLPSSKDIDINVKTSVLSSVGSSLAASIASAFPKFASGTKEAPGGPALVNENGPEMIAANGLAWIAGGGNPTVTMLPRGATVLTASETRRATGGRGVGVIPSFEDGTSQYLTTSIFGGTERNPNIRSSNTGSKYRVRYCPVCGTANPVGAPRCVACGYSFLTGKMPGATGSTASGAYNTGGASGPAAPNFKALEDELSKRLKNLDAQAELAENQEDFLKAMQIYGDAQKYISELLDLYRENGYAEDSDEVLKLANLGYDYASKQLGGYDDLQKRLIDALNALTDATEDANAIAERQEAVNKAREALANAERQRTVRIFNPVTGQWEWVANAGDVEKARESLKSAEQALEKEQLDQTISAIKNAKPEELAGLTLSPAILDKLFNGTPEQQTAFLNALNAATGGADYLGSAAAQTAFNQGNTIGTQYNLNGIELTQEMAAGMSIKQLLDMLRGLQLM